MMRRSLRLAWGAVHFVGQVVLLGALIFVVIGGLYVFFGGPQ